MKKSEEGQTGYEKVSEGHKRKDFIRPLQPKLAVRKIIIRINHHPYGNSSESSLKESQIFLEYACEKLQEETGGGILEEIFN